MRAPRWWPERGLWRHPAFLRLWAAQVISAMGSRITRTALPVIAVSLLAATPGEVSLMMAMVFVPGLLLAVFVGGHIDRGDKRAILVGADLVRAAAVASIPLAAWTGTLGLAQVIVVGAVVGAATAVFQITDNSYLPQLIGKEHLVEGNAKLEATDSVAEIVGPAAAGGLIGVLGGPLAVLVDAASYVWSAAFLIGLPGGRGAPAETTATRRHPLADLAAGMRALASDRAVLRLAIASALEHVALGFFVSLYMVYTLRELDLGAATVGIVIGFGGVGALLGAFGAQRMANALGLAGTLLVAMLLSRAASFLIPLAAEVDRPAAIALLIAHQLIGDGFMVVFAVHAITLRQSTLPGEVLGRANAASHVLTVGAMLAGAVIGGVLGDAYDARAGLWIGSAAGLAAPVILLRSRKY